MSDKGSPTAAPAGLTCLNEVAAGSPVASFNSLTSCQPLRASKRLINPGLPFTTVIGRSPFSIKTRAGFWLGLHPYLSSSSFILVDNRRILRKIQWGGIFEFQGNFRSTRKFSQFREFSSFREIIKYSGLSTLFRDFLQRGIQSGSLDCIHFLWLLLQGSDKIPCHSGVCR